MTLNSHDELLDHRKSMVTFIYDNKKGKTIFPNLDVEIECKQGSLLMFPPMWPWLHAGQKPSRVSKYIMQSYLHYV